MNIGLSQHVRRHLESDERILSAAISVFGRKGYANSTLSEIASGANVSLALVTQRFYNKENLFSEAFLKTQIRSFYQNEESTHMPNALYILLDNLKREVVEQPDWFSFLEMIHNGTDIPKSFSELTYGMFMSTPIPDAFLEAQKAGYLPEGDPWTMFQLFFRNSVNLIGWYHRLSLPMPDNDTFLYAIQYNRRDAEAQAEISRQKGEISEMRTDQRLLKRVVCELYPLSIFIDFKANRYHMIEYDHYTTRKADSSGVYDELIRVGASTVPDPIQSQHFLQMFGRENMISAFERGEKDLTLRHQQLGDDGIVRWFETRCVFCGESEYRAISITRCIDAEVKQLKQFEKTLRLSQEISASKTRLLSQLSREILTASDSVGKSVQKAKEHPNDAQSVVQCAESIQCCADQLSRLLQEASITANSDQEQTLSEYQLDLNDYIASCMNYADSLASFNRISVMHEIKGLKTSCVYADGVKLEQIVSQLTRNVVQFVRPGGKISFVYQQLDSELPGKTVYEIAISDNGTGMNPDFMERMCNASEKQIPVNGGIGDSSDLGMRALKRNLRLMGAIMDIQTDPEAGTTARCRFPFRTA